MGRSRKSQLEGLSNLFFYFFLLLMTSMGDTSFRRFLEEKSRSRSSPPPSAHLLTDEELEALEEGRELLDLLAGRLLLRSHREVLSVAICGARTRASENG